MDISIVGASGACGRGIVNQIVRDRLLERREILQLVSLNPSSSHPYLLDGFRADLQDAFAESVPELDVTSDPREIVGDIVVVAGGITFATDPLEVGSASRDMLARANRPVFEKLARAFRETRPENPPIVIVVTNPVELGVHIFSQYIPRQNVIGMGAYSDSMRFRWEIAHDLNVGRGQVHGYVLAEHGAGMVPLWSTVKVYGMSPAEWRVAERRIRCGMSTNEFHDRLHDEQKRLIEFLTGDPVRGPARALAHVSALPPDLRVALKPFAIHFTGAKTIEATCHAVVELVTAIVAGRPLEIAAQYEHEGESGIRGPFGARLILATNVERLLPIESYWREETELIYRSAENTWQKVKEWMSDE